MTFHSTSGLVSAMALGLFGCAPAIPDAGWTVVDYRADSVQRATTLTRCANDPGRYEMTPECRNAVAAERVEGIGSLRDLPPLVLTLPPMPPIEGSATPSAMER